MRLSSGAEARLRIGPAAEIRCRSGGSNVRREDDPLSS
jgi:hypothetical protein